MTGLTLPPLMSSEVAIDDPMDQAIMRAVQGCDSGLMAYRLGPNQLEAALVFAPDVVLDEAMVMLPLCGIGFQNALGALAPPEVAVHLGWDGAIYVNGARCGALQAAAATDQPDAVPDWLVVGLTLHLVDTRDDPGATPDQTALYSEGCADVEPLHLLEAWARHTLNWIGRWEQDGTRPLHDEWRGLAHGMGETATQGGHSGTFLGTDERFGMLLRDDDTTHLIPLPQLLRQWS